MSAVAVVDLGVEAFKKTPTSRRRASCLFMIRLTPTEIYPEIRLDVRDALPPSVSWLVSAERDSRTGELSHLHVFLKTTDNWLLSDLVNYFNCLFDHQWGLDVQKVRSERNCLKYCSKEDIDLLTNVSVSKLSLFYQSHVWSNRVVSYSFSDPFAFEHRNNYKYFQNFLQEKQKAKVSPFRTFKEYDLLHCTWADQCSTWWNHKIKGWFHKQSNLYLYGEKNCGKSTFINRLIGKENLKFVYYPDVGKFAFGDLDVNFHKIIVFEEFDIKFHCVSMLKRLCEGLPFRAPQKFTSGQVIHWKFPVIFVSNYCDIEDDAFRCRLDIVHCNEAYYEKKASLRIQVKEEETHVQEIEEVCISSDEE